MDTPHKIMIIKQHNVYKYKISSTSFRLYFIEHLSLFICYY